MSRVASLPLPAQLGFRGWEGCWSVTLCTAFQRKSTLYKAQEGSRFFYLWVTLVPPQPSAGLELDFIKHDIFVSSLMLLVLFSFLLLSIKGFFFSLPEILWGFETHFKEEFKKKKIHLRVLVMMGVKTAG